MADVYRSGQGAPSHEFETRLSDRMADRFLKDILYPAFVNNEEKGKMVNGKTVQRVSADENAIVVEDYISGKLIEPKSASETIESLNIVQKKIAHTYVDDFDAIQSNYNLQNEYGDILGKKLAHRVDRDILAQVVNARTTLDAASFGGNAGDGIDLTSSNVMKVLNRMTTKLSNLEVAISGSIDSRMDSRFGLKAGFVAASPNFVEAITEHFSGIETPEGDKNRKANHVASLIQGYELHQTTSSLWTGVLGMSGQALADETITVNGVTFTFKAALTPAAGEVVIGGDAAATQANFIAALNGAAGEGVTYSAVSTADRATLDGVSGAADGTNVAVTALGANYVEVSTTMSEAANVWSKEKQHLLAGKRGCVDMVSQKEPMLEVAKEARSYGAYLKSACLYGRGMFAESQRRAVEILINTVGF